MHKALYDLTHGLPGLGVFYGAVFVILLAGIIREKGPVRVVLKVPLFALLIMGIEALIGWGVLGPVMRSLGAARDGMAEFIGGATASGVLNYYWGRAIGSHARQAAAGAQYRRGAVVQGEWRRSRRPSGESGVTLADVPVALQEETKHFKIIGATGTGKSTAIQEILEAALARGDRAIIADPDGSYRDLFHDAARGDVILNPFEPGALKWDLFGEIFNRHDVELLGRSLIPDPGGEGHVWSDYARTFFTCVVGQLITLEEKDDSHLLRLIKAASRSELNQLLAGTAAGPFLEEGNERMFGSLRAVASSAVRVLEYTTAQRAPPFSVRQWVRQGAARHCGGAGGVLFLPYRASQIEALRSVISAWMRLGIFEAMDRLVADQRLWFVIDELDALGTIDGLKDALARLRKFGGRCVLGFQSIAQVSGTYGRAAADTLVENCGNTLILRCSASEQGGTSEFASKLVGQREVMQVTQSRTRTPGEWFSSVTTGQQIKIEPALMASEIERLPDLGGFLKLASQPDWLRVTLTRRAGPRKRPFEPNLGGAQPAGSAGPEPAAARVAPNVPGPASGEPVYAATATRGPPGLSAMPPGGRN